MKLPITCLEPVIAALQSLGIELVFPSSAPTGPSRDAFDMRASAWVVASTLIDAFFT